MKENTKKITIDSLTKGNIWTLSEAELNRIIIDGKKRDDYDEYESHYMNIIRPVFDIQLLDREDEKKVAELEALHFEIFSYPNDGQNNAMAIRKRPIKKITDLTLENIYHLEASEVLELIENNLGTGWKGLPLSIQDIIESAFYVDCSVLPEYAMHRKGGIIERRKNDGYDVLELVRGTWIEGIFIKPKPRFEKPRFETPMMDEDNPEANDDIEDDDIDDDNDCDNSEDSIESVNFKTKPKRRGGRSKSSNSGSDDDISFEDLDGIDVIDE
jgi:hypothetical protein